MHLNSYKFFYINNCNILSAYNPFNVWRCKTNKADPKRWEKGIDDDDNIISSNISLHLFIHIGLQVTYQQLSTYPSRLKLVVNLQHHVIDYC